MNIIIITDHYPPFYKGAYEINCQQIADGLISLNHSVTILTSKFGVNYSTIPEKNVYRLLYLLSSYYINRIHRRFIHIINFFQGRKNFLLTKSIAQKVKPDFAFIWHIQGASLLPIFALQDLKIPTIFRIGSHWLIQEKEKYFDNPSAIKRWYNCALLGFRKFQEIEFNSAIFVSHSLKESYYNAGIQFDHNAIIKSGLPEKWILKSEQIVNMNNKKLNLLYAGRIEEEKGTYIAIKAVKHLVNHKKYHRLKLDIIGSGNEHYIQKLKDIVKSNSLENNIYFKPFLPREELIKIYKHYDILLFTTPKLEGLPMTIIEAMSKGVLVIACNIGGPKDIIDNGINGLLIPPNDYISLSEAIEKIIKNPNSYLDMRIAAINKIRNQHNFQQMLAEYEKYLHLFNMNLTI